MQSGSGIDVRTQREVRYSDRRNEAHPVKRAIQQAANVVVLSARLYRELAVSALSIIPARSPERR